MKKTRLNPKETWKLIGNIAAVIAVIFVVRRFIRMDVDPKVFSSPRVIAAAIITASFGVVSLCVNCFPWLKFVEVLSDRKIPFQAAMIVYAKSNIYKYVPGNVFQYVGRNKLAADLSISNVDVVCATVLDLICGIIPTTLISAIMLGRYVMELVRRYWKGAAIFFAVGIALLLIIAAAVFTFRKKLAGYIDRYRSAFTKVNRAKFIAAIVFYFMMALISCAVNLLNARLVFDGAADFGQLITITGAYGFAFILGYITPGAPGGIGIRESVMLLVCGGMYEESALVYVLVYRVASIISDISGFILSLFVEKKNQVKGD